MLSAVLIQNQACNEHPVSRWIWLTIAWMMHLSGSLLPWVKYTLCAETSTFVLLPLCGRGRVWGRVWGWGHCAISIFYLTNYIFIMCSPIVICKIRTSVNESRSYLPWASAKPATVTSGGTGFLRRHGALCAEITHTRCVLHIPSGFTDSPFCSPLSLKTNWNG